MIILFLFLKLYNIDLLNNFVPQIVCFGLIDSRKKVCNTLNNVYRLHIFTDFFIFRSINSKISVTIFILVPLLQLTICNLSGFLFTNEFGIRICISSMRLTDISYITMNKRTSLFLLSPKGQKKKLPQNPKQQVYRA